LKKYKLLILFAFVFTFCGENLLFAQDSIVRNPCLVEFDQTTTFCFDNSIKNEPAYSKTFCIHLKVKPEKIALLGNCAFPDKGFCIRLGPGESGCMDLLHPYGNLEDWFEVDTTISTHLFNNLDFEDGDGFPVGWVLGGNGIAETMTQDSFFGTFVHSGKGTKFLKLSFANSSQKYVSLSYTQKFNATMFRLVKLDYVTNAGGLIFFNVYGWDETTQSRKVVSDSYDLFDSYYSGFPSLQKSYDISKFTNRLKLYLDGNLEKYKPDSMEIIIYLENFPDVKDDVLYIDNIVFEEQFVSIEKTVQPELRVYPNPCHSSFKIISPIKSFSRIQIFNSQGQLVQDLPVFGQNEFDVRFLEPGFYTLVLEDEKNQIRLKTKLVKM